MGLIEPLRYIIIKCTRPVLELKGNLLILFSRRRNGPYSKVLTYII